MPGSPGSSRACSNVARAKRGLGQVGPARPSVPALHAQAQARPASLGLGFLVWKVDEMIPYFITTKPPLMGVGQGSGQVPIRKTLSCHFASDWSPVTREACFQCRGKTGSESWQTRVSRLHRLLGGRSGGARRGVGPRCCPCDHPPRTFSPPWHVGRAGVNFSQATPPVGPLSCPVWGGVPCTQRLQSWPSVLRPPVARASAPRNGFPGEERQATRRRTGNTRGNIAETPGPEESRAERGAANDKECPGCSDKELREDQGEAQGEKKPGVRMSREKAFQAGAGAASEKALRQDAS